jgi:hypothetical protein
MENLESPRKKVMPATRHEFARATWPSRSDRHHASSSSGAVHPSGSIYRPLIVRDRGGTLTASPHRPTTTHRWSVVAPCLLSLVMAAPTPTARTPLTWPPLSSDTTTLLSPRHAACPSVVLRHRRLPPSSPGWPTPKAAQALHYRAVMPQHVRTHGRVPPWSEPESE